MKITYLVVFVLSVPWMLVVTATEQAPKFLTEFPQNFAFSNSTGGKLTCTVKDDSDSKITWILSDGSPVSDVDRLRQVSSDGTLSFPPFRAEDYRQDVHGVYYRCAATNALGTLVSNEIKVKGVVTQIYDVHVYDVYVINGNSAVMKCHIPKFLQSYVKVVAWIKDSVISITSRSVTSDSKYFLLPTGELIIKDVDASDALTTYRCQVVHDLTGEVKVSSNAGRLIVTDSDGKVPPKIIFSQAQLSVINGGEVLVPCIANGQPTPKYSWSKQLSTGNVASINETRRIKLISGSLVIKQSQQSDGGLYNCLAENEVNIDKAMIHVSVIESLRVTVSPSVTTIDTSQPVTLTCKISGSPIVSVVWMKDGNLLPIDGITLQNNDTLLISGMQSNHVGIYQCFAQNELFTAYGMSIVKLGDTKPVIRGGFQEMVLDPGQKLTLNCSARGNPAPEIYWTMDNMNISENINTQFIGNSDVIGFVVVSNVKVQNGGLYRCIAKNRVGTAAYMARINVRGKLGVRRLVEYSATEDDKIEIDCPIYGYPIKNIKWERNGHTLPLHIRQAIYKNGSLSIHNTQRMSDSGKYDCIAVGDDGKVAKGSVNLLVMVAPKITPFFFQDDLIREGARARITCVVSEGQSPMAMIWLKNNQILTDEQESGITIRQLDEFSSILMISFISPRHNGNYTCVATNAAGTARHSARLNVNVPPKIVPFAFQDDQFFKGMRAHIICAVSQGDTPITFEWLKDGLPISASFGIITRDYDGHANSLSIESVSSTHTGNYTCIAHNQAAKVSYSAQLLVQVVPKITPFAFRNNMFKGNQVRVSCVIYQGDSPLTIRWFKNGQLTDLMNGITTRNIDNYSSILTIENLELQHSGNYTCEARNAASSATYSAQLIVHVPPKVVPFAFQDEYLLEGMLVRVSCVVSRGDLPLTISWLKDGEAIPPKLFVTIREFDEYSSVLSIDPVMAKHTGSYTCTAQNHAGISSHTAKLIVQVPPQWILEPNDVLAQTGDHVVLNCQADGFPKPTITWKKSLDTYNIHDESAPVIENENVKIFGNGTLSFQGIQQLDEGHYICLASNNIKEPLSKIVSVQVHVAPHFMISEQEIFVNRGKDVKIPCEASGNWPITYKWTTTNNQIIQNNGGERYDIKESQDEPNARSYSTLHIKWVDRKDSTVFICRATNKIGESQMSIKVTVQEIPSASLIEEPVNVVNQTVELRWNISFDGNSKITKYFIQFKKEVDRWDNKADFVTIAGSKNTAKIERLKPATVYSFRVMSENHIGNGTFSEIVSVRTDETTPGGQPENIDVESTDANTLRVSWKPPNKSLWNGVIRGYNVGYIEIDTLDSYIFTSLEVPEDYTEEVIFQLTDLKMYTQYNVVVQAYNSKGNGPLSEPVLAMTSEDVPSSPPEDVRCSSLSAKSIYVLWDSPASDKINGILRGYKVLYKPVDQWYDGIMQSQITQLAKVTLNNLEVHTNYSIQVLALTKMGDGVRSHDIFCKTHEDVPEPPEVIKVLPSSADSVVVAWKPPRKTNGAVIKYNVYYKAIHNGQQIDLDAQNTQNLRDAKIIQADANNNFVELKQLKKNQKYAFWVTATSAIGESTGSTIVAQTVADSIVAAKSASFDSVIKTPWKEDIIMPCSAVGVPTPNRKWTMGSQILMENNRRKINSDGSVIITNVVREDSGNYSCSVYNEYGRDKVNYVVAVQVPPSSPAMEVVSKTRSSIKLQWKPALNSAELIRGYILHYKDDNGVWNTKEITPDQQFYTLDKLTCGTTYQLSLEAFNNIGNGVPSNEITVTTDGADIVPPSKESIIREGSSFITVYLTEWPSHGCPVKSFSVEYKAVNAKEWVVAGTNIKPSQMKLVVSGLTPATWYLLRLKVDTMSTPIVAEYRFATHTTAGGTLPPEIIHQETPVFIFQLDPLIFIPAVILFIVVVVAIMVLVVVCCCGKKRNERIDLPTGSDFGGNVWEQHMQTIPRGHFMHAASCKTDPSPYATSQLIDFPIDVHQGTLRKVLPTRYRQEQFQQSSGYPNQDQMDENIFAIHDNTEPSYDPPPLSHMIRSGPSSPNHAQLLM